MTCSTVLGYSDGDFDQAFAPEFAGLDWDGIGIWYNWRGWERVYNPYGVFLLLWTREFHTLLVRDGIPGLPVPNADGEIRESDGIGNRLADMPRLSKFDLADYLECDAGCG